MHSRPNALIIGAFNCSGIETRLDNKLNDYLKKWTLCILCERTIIKGRKNIFSLVWCTMVEYGSDYRFMIPMCTSMSFTIPTSASWVSMIDSWLPNLVLIDFLYIVRVESHNCGYNGQYKSILIYVHYKVVRIITLDSGIDLAPGINVAHGTFGKNIKCSP